MEKKIELHYSKIPQFHHSRFFTVGTFKILNSLNIKIFLTKEGLSHQYYNDSII